MSEDELEPHLRAALGEVRDQLEVTRRPRQTAPQPGPELELPEHLAGRDTTDRFTRGGGRPAPKPPRPKEPKLERHLAERLKEVSDEAVLGGGPSAWEDYQAMRKRLQGG